MIARLVKTIGMLALMIGAIGCIQSPDLDDEDAEDASDALVMTGAEQQLVLAVVNDPQTDLALLDIEIGLDSRAAQNILVYRAGADGAFPSADDNLFELVGELDTVSYVGDVALEKLRAYAVEHAPPPPSQAGTYDGVTFDDATAQAALFAAQTLTRDQLVAAGLPQNGASVIVGNRPYETLLQVSQVSGVGNATMKKLHVHASANP